jgi:hypothetical protein
MKGPEGAPVLEQTALVRWITIVRARKGDKGVSIRFRLVIDLFPYFFILVDRKAPNQTDFLPTLTRSPWRRPWRSASSPAPPQRTRLVIFSVLDQR